MSNFESAAPSIQINLLGQCFKSNKDVAHLTAQKRTSLCSLWKEEDSVKLSQWGKTTKQEKSIIVLHVNKHTNALTTWEFCNSSNSMFFNTCGGASWDSKCHHRYMRWEMHHKELKQTSGYSTLYATAREAVASWTIKRICCPSNFRASKSRAATSILSLPVITNKASLNLWIWITRQHQVDNYPPTPPAKGKKEKRKKKSPK